MIRKKWWSDKKWYKINSEFILPQITLSNFGDCCICCLLSIDGSTVATVSGEIVWDTVDAVVVVKIRLFTTQTPLPFSDLN